MNPFYKLNKLLTKDYLYHSVRDLGFKETLNLRNVNQLLNKYRKILFEAEQLPITRGIQNFETDFQFEDEQFYKMSWNVEFAEEVIKKNKIKAKVIEIKHLESSLIRSSYNEDHLDYALQNQNPIIVGHYPMSEEKYIIIDGNHRVMARNKKNIRKVKAYVLKPNEHLQAMNGEIYRALYKVHYNYWLLIKLVAGELSKEDFYKRMYKL